jgi:hypothetical protein
VTPAVPVHHQATVAWVVAVEAVGRSRGRVGAAKLVSKLRVMLDTRWQSRRPDRCSALAFAQLIHGAPWPTPAAPFVVVVAAAVVVVAAATAMTTTMVAMRETAVAACL